MNLKEIHIGKVFLVSALIMLVFGLLMGVMASLNYILPGNLKETLGFISLRPMHVSAVMFWILLGATGCIYSVIKQVGKQEISRNIAIAQWLLWMIAIGGIFHSYFIGKFGGREYWEFDPIWSLPIAIAWGLLIFNFFKAIRGIGQWPVYVWMWMTGIVFFLFTFVENHLWLFSYFRQDVVTDMTIQWKVNGSLVGSWNQILYGTAFFLMDRITGTSAIGKSKLVFAMYFLGLFNLMFNWGHHIYTLPTEPYIRYFGYAVSMTEWIIFIRIVYNWKQTVTEIQKHYHYFPYRFLMASDFWVFLNVCQALFMSIPAINIFTHGTHVTVAHAMGTTIGINSMILLACCFEFLSDRCSMGIFPVKKLNKLFWTAQVCLVIFWLSLNIAGIQKGIWQLSAEQIPFSKMMEGLRPWFVLFFVAGIGLMITLSSIAVILVHRFIRCLFTNRHKLPVQKHNQNLQILN